MFRRQKPDGWYAYPEHYSGVSGVLRRLLWRLGFDPLTLRERIRQLDHERSDWKRWLEEAEHELERRERSA